MATGSGKDAAAVATGQGRRGCCHSDRGARWPGNREAELVATATRGDAEGAAVPMATGAGEAGMRRRGSGGGIWAASSALGQDRDTAVAPLAGTAGVGALRSRPKNLPGWARRRAQPRGGAAGSECEQCEQGAVWVWQKIPGSASCDGHSHLQAREDEKAEFLCAPDSTLLAF